MAPFVSLLSTVIYLFIIVILVRVVFSWVDPFAKNTMARIAFAITEPVLGPVRRLLPPMSGMDLSPLVVTLALYFVIAALRNIR